MQGKNLACAYVPVGTGKNNASKVQESIFRSVSPQELASASFLLSAFHQVILSHGLGYCACLGTNSMSPEHSLGCLETGFVGRPLPDTLITYQVCQTPTEVKGYKSASPSPLQAPDKTTLAVQQWLLHDHHPLLLTVPTLGKLPSPFHTSASQACRAVKG